MPERGDCRWSSGTSRASRIAQLIAADFFGDRLELASRDMSREDEELMRRMSPSSSDQVEGRTWLGMPEVEAVHGLQSSGAARESEQDSSRLYSVRTSAHIRAHGGNDRAVRLFLTFVSAMDRARDATQLWRAAMRLYRERPATFDPKHVAGLDVGTLLEVLRSAAVSRRHRPDAAAWHQIATSLAYGPESPVRRMIETGRGDAQELLRDLTTRDDEGLTRFPLLRGPKIRLMWIRMMVNPGQAVIDRIGTIPVAVDVQVRRVTENLGVTATRGLRLRKAKPVIHQAWLEAVSEADIGGPPGIAGTCAALDPALWFFEKHGCGHCEKADRKVRFGRACDHCVRFSRRSSDRDRGSRTGISGGVTRPPEPR